MAYTTNLTVPQFAVLEPLLPQSKTYQSVISRHHIVNAILYQLKNGCQWRDLPSDFPNWSTVYSQFRRWQLDGTWQQVLAALATSERQKEKKTNFRVC
jgi:transposase